MSTELLDESPLYREWIEAAEARGYARGYGRGYARGYALGMRKITLRVLESRFGAVELTLAQAIDQADKDTLDALLPHVVLGTLEQLRRLLGVQES